MFSSFFQNSAHVFFIARLPPAWVFYKFNFIKSGYKIVSNQKVGRDMFLGRCRARCLMAIFQWC